jgi:hypothetical protein
MKEFYTELQRLASAGLPVGEYERRRDEVLAGAILSLPKQDCGVDRFDERGLIRTCVPDGLDGLTAAILTLFSNRRIDQLHGREGMKEFQVSREQILRIIEWAAGDVKLNATLESFFNIKNGTNGTD